MWLNRPSYSSVKVQEFIKYKYIFPTLTLKTEEWSTATDIASLSYNWQGSMKADSHIACRAHAALLPCRGAKGLECVFPIWYTQCGRVWFTLDMPHPCHALTMPLLSRPRHGQSMASVNHTRPHCVNQMGKTHSKPSEARHGRRTAWGRNAMCESALSEPSRCVIYRVIHKSLRDFRTRLRNNQDRHGRKEHINR